MEKILSYSLVLVVLIVLLWTCKDEEDIIPPIGAGDSTITDSERMEVFEACQKKSAELNNLESLEDRITFLSWLATQPAFYSYGFAGEDLYAIFVDGRIVLFVTLHWGITSEEGWPQVVVPQGAAGPIIPVAEPKTCQSQEK